jgi:hypothetical protein
MRNLLSTLSLLLLGLWLGGLVFFGFVAKVAFDALPPLFPNHPAGIHAAFLLFTLVLSRFVHWHSYTPQALLVLAMLVLTAYSQFSIIPRMNTARDSVGGEVTAVAENNPGREIFDHLHQQSTHVEAAVLICGLFAFLFAGRPQKIRTAL